MTNDQVTAARTAANAFREVVRIRVRTEGDVSRLTAYTNKRESAPVEIVHKTTPEADIRRMVADACRSIAT